MAALRLEIRNGVWSDDCPPRHTAYHCEDPTSTEYEVSMGIGGLVSMLQPEIVVEAGTHRGGTTRWIGAALASSGHGRCYALDTAPGVLQAVRRRCIGTPVEAVQADARAWAPPGPIDLLYVDDGVVEARTISLAHLLPYLAPHGVVLIHDTGTHWGLGRLLLATYRPPDWLVFPLPTPRGLTLLRRGVDADGRPLPPPRAAAPTPPAV